MSEKILIIDDDLDTLRLVGLMLQRQGYQISAATNGQQGLDKAFEEDPDLILLDIMMPDLDGYEVTRRLRQNPSTLETPILMFTAKTQLDDKVIGFEVGANDYLTKPTHPTELQARVKSLLARRNETRGGIEPAKDESHGYVIGVLGACGGLGTTTLAVNLAAGLHARLKGEVIIAEMLPGQGALALDMGLTNSKGLVDLLGISKLNEITRDRVREALVQHPSGLKILLASDRPRDMHLVNQTANYQEIVKTLAMLARFVILDLGMGLQPFAEKVLPFCDQALIVLEGVPNTIIHTRALIDDISALGINRKNINAVLNNRIRSDTQLPASQVQNKLDHEIVSMLTPAPELFVQATRMQTPALLCQPDSLTARQISKLVDFIAERVGASQMSQAAGPTLATVAAIEDAAELFRQAKRTVVLTGAGISSLSGIPDFRSEGSGLWSHAEPMEVASLTTFRISPERFFSWFRPLAGQICNAKPNAAHKALAELENAGHKMTIVTQNIDGLHQKAGSVQVVEMHGSLRTLSCTQCFKQVGSDPFLGSYIVDGKIPQCLSCNGILKPDVILFGEQLPQSAWFEAQSATRQCDLMLVAGSSLEVLPVAGLPMQALDRGAHLIVINNTPTYVNVRADVVLMDNVASIIPEITKRVLHG